MPPTVSIIILNWNGRHLLERFLPSVVASSYQDAEIVVADNASTDDSLSWLETKYPAVKVIRHPENWGFCRGYNEAIVQTEGDFIVLLNNDVEVEPNWLQPLLAEMESDPGLGAVQPKLLDANDRGRFEYAGAAGGHIDQYGYPFTRGRVFFTVEDDHGQYDDTTDILWATGAAMLLRRSCLEKTGLLDERFEFHMEEIDLCWRLHRSGYAIRVVPESVVYHLGGSSLPASSARKTFYNYRNNLLMLRKNLPKDGRRRVFLVRFLLDFAALVRFAVSGGPSHAWAVIRAYRDFGRLKDQAPRKPADLPTGHPTPTGHRTPDTGHLPSYSGSIVVDYFLHGRKRYSDLPRENFRLGQ